MSARRVLSGGVLVLMLSGCAARAAGPVEPQGPYGTAQPVRSPEVATTSTVLGVIATPFYLVFKTAVCAASLVIAVPGAALLGLTDRAYEERWRQELDEGLAENCGPPYTLLNNTTPAP
jgi:hypothetical protein